MECKAFACALGVASLLCAGSIVRAQSELPPVIPIFPLEVTMLFPGVSRPLHIFEPRYRAMVADALRGDRIIGMTLLQPGFEAEYEGRPPVYPIGCAGLITHSEALQDGRFNIVLRGMEKFRITGEDNSRTYRLPPPPAAPSPDSRPPCPTRIWSTPWPSTYRSNRSNARRFSSARASRHAAVA